MRILLATALAALASAQNYCTNDVDGEFHAQVWTEDNPDGWYCRCAADVGANPDYAAFEDACKSYTNLAACYGATVQGTDEACTWLSTKVKGELPTDGPPENPTTGYFESDGTLIDCDGKEFSANDCAYRNKGNCDDYLGDGICDFGQRFTKAGVRTGPNLACDKFANDKGDCDCPDTMTCDGYCLDDYACQKEAYGFTGCHNWYSDNVCDYGQRTSDFGVSINFDCKISWVPALANMDHDQGACEPWDWDKRYTTQEYLDNFKAECPTAMPTINPTNEPSQQPTESPVAEANTLCPTWKQVYGNWDKCCEEFGAYEDPLQNNIDVCIPVETGFVCDPSLDKESCELSGPAYTCQFDKSQKKGQRCVAIPDDGCNFRYPEGHKKEGQFNKSECEANSDKCAFAKLPERSYCFAYDHICETYTKKNKCSISAADGNLCVWDVGTKSCAPSEEVPSCGSHEKKKICKAFGTGGFGCSWIKKPQDRPSWLSKTKCVDITDPEYIAWTTAGPEEIDCSSFTKAAKCENNEACVWDEFYMNTGGCLPAGGTGVNCAEFTGPNKCGKQEGCKWEGDTCINA